ncbi:hypothetical protein MNB_SUP05-SYMBIONT-5-80 [hydrothermal vent metagenome]|uniref:Uncharacterized protein n=1 Tax=hydrothermal vent metagenome TaxID=652676 RepID=A0A1W1E4Z0_9ZZZZ
MCNTIFNSKVPVSLPFVKNNDTKNIFLMYNASLRGEKLLVKISDEGAVLFATRVSMIVMCHLAA